MSNGISSNNFLMISFYNERGSHNNLKKLFNLNIISKITRDVTNRKATKRTINSYGQYMEFTALLNNYNNNVLFITMNYVILR